MSDQARIFDPCTHVGTMVTTGSPDTLVGYQLAARLGDLTTPCPICKIPLPGRIVKGSRTVFINKMPAARVSDKVICGAGVPPAPPGGFHMPASEYKVRPEDNYVDAVFMDDSMLIVEPPKGGNSDVVQKKPLSRFLKGLSLDLNIGMRFALKLSLSGPNSIAMGCFSVKVGG